MSIIKEMLGKYTHAHSVIFVSIYETFLLHLSILYTLVIDICIWLLKEGL